MNRRESLRWVLACAMLRGRSVDAHVGPGPVNPPTSAPDLLLQDHHGLPLRLRPWMAGRVTLVQTIFTGCSSVCPLQGAVFAELQRRLASRSPRLPVQLLSVSIDALGDTSESLAAWLSRMQARHPGWVAALPTAAGVEVLRNALDGSPEIRAAERDSHSDKVYCFDAHARLRWRSGPLPSSDELLQVAQHFSR